MRRHFADFPAGGYLIYHPSRWISKFPDHPVAKVVYHDEIRNSNQDPYIWRAKFLHTYCHITQISPRAGHINLWVSGDKFPNFEHLCCDLVFTVGEEPYYWKSSQEFTEEERTRLAVSKEAMADHFQWASKGQHPLKKRRRYTLQADPMLSFQPQTKEGKLIDILEMLERDYGFSRDQLMIGLRAGFSSKPMKLPPDVVQGIRRRLAEPVYRQIYGKDLESLRKAVPASIWGKEQARSD